MSEWKEFKKQHYGEYCVVNYSNGFIDFSPDGMKSVKNGEGLSYNQYLEVQRNSCEHCRTFFEMSYFNNYLCDYKGQIDRIDTTRGKVVFKRLFIDGMYHDGIGFFGKEDHVWMDLQPFQQYSVGDCIRFTASIYRYIKTGGGKQIAFGLENPEDIKQISSYDVPTDQELVDQQIDQLVCETCKFYDNCFMDNCISNKEDRENRIELLKSLEPGKFTPLTVMLAYELEYRMLLQNGGIRLDRRDKNYHVMKRFIEICDNTPMYYYGNPEEAIVRMMMPDKPRLYIE